MASKEEYDRYAQDLTQRFDELVQWAIAHWPRTDFPLMRSDFDASRRELADILGPKLGDPEPGAQNEAQDPFLPPGMAPERGGEFRDQNPMPWP